MYYILYTIYYILCTIYYILCTIYYTLCTIYYILCTIYYALYTIYYALYTIHYNAKLNGSHTACETVTLAAFGIDTDGGTALTCKAGGSKVTHNSVTAAAVAGATDDTCACCDAI